MENMNKENFWNYLFEYFPKSVQEFLEFIDKYKEENLWNEIFYGVVKFHDVPVQMQLGIWIQFLIEQGWTEFSFGFDIFDLENLMDWVYEYFRDREIDLNILN